jgi:hypothetical protein
MMTCEVVFSPIRDRGQIVIRKVVELSGKRSFKDLTGTAVIKLASAYYFQNKKVSLKEFIRRDDPIVIKAGYDGNNRVLFNGYVVAVLPNIPVEIKCENAMYMLKKTAVNVSYKSVSLQKLLTEICPSGTEIDALNIDLGAFKAVKTNVAAVLEKIKEQYGLVAYFKDTVLKVGKIYQDISTTPIATLNFQKNIRSSGLEYRYKDDIKLKVKAISNLSSGKKIEVTVGDENGEERTLNYYNITSEATLKELATAQIDKMKIEGYKGNIKLYGLPAVDMTEVVTIEDPDYPEKNGNYFTDSYSFKFSESGFEQEVEISQQAS